MVWSYQWYESDMTMMTLKWQLHYNNMTLKWHCYDWNDWTKPPLDHINNRSPQVYMDTLRLFDYMHLFCPFVRTFIDSCQAPGSHPVRNFWYCSQRVSGRLFGVSGRAVMIPLISGSGIGIAIWTKEPEPELIPRWNRLQEWNRIQSSVISHNIYQILGKWPIWASK